jgi:uncharacterized protein YoxC
MFLKVEGGQYVKDTGNKALLTVNPIVLQENEARKKLASKINSKNDEINTLKNEVKNLSSDMSEIKQMLSQLLNQKV